MPRTNSGPREIEGLIEDWRPRIAIELVDPAIRLENVLVDTGFSGWLVVPVGTFSEWGRQAEASVTTVRVADGTVRDTLSIHVEVYWLGERKSVQVLELGPESIVGMRLLMGTRMSVEEGRIRIQRRTSTAASRTAG
jgi:predicted aspartyl protease